MRLHHPNCPSKHRGAIVARVAGRAWIEANIGKAVGITMDCYVRHTLTEYEGLLASGMNRDVARKMVKSKVDETIASWAPAPAS
ncbi:DUF2293 domain-containing protein [Methylosinus trichosporium]